MADGILPPRPARVPFFRTASDDELVDVEAFIQARCAALYRVELFPRDRAAAVRLRRIRRRFVQLDPLRAFKAGEMRQAIERAVLTATGALREPGWLRDRTGDLLATLPKRAELDPFVGIYARSADLEAFAVVHWSVHNEPEAVETPEQRYVRAAELHARLQNFAAVGRELNVGRERAKQLVAKGQAIIADTLSTPPVDTASKAKPSKAEK